LDPTGHTVLIIAGEHAGLEGICLGKATDGSDRWAVSPDGSDKVLYLVFDKEFGVLLNPSQEAGKS